MRLLRVELARLAARRVTLVVVLMVLLGIAGVTAITAAQSRVPTTADQAEAQRFADSQTREQLARCERQQASPPAEQPTGEFEGVKCDQLGAVPSEYFLPAPPFDFRDAMPRRVEGLAVVLAMAGFLIGASLVGAEWSAGTLAALLTWEPRRVRVALTKLGALLLGVTALAALAYAELVGGSWLAADQRGTTDRVTVPFQQSLGLTTLRGLAVALAATAVGYALALALRSTAAALGVGFAYFAAAEIGLRLVDEDTQRWLATSNMAAWLERGGVRIPVYDCAPTGDCRERVIAISQWQGGAFLAAVALALLVLAVVVFRRRDIT